MKAAFIHAFTPRAEGARIGSFTLPFLRKGEVKVRIACASVNPLDIKMIRGELREVYPIALPYIPGLDFSGTVEDVGDAVTWLHRGDRVVGRRPTGSGGAFAQANHCRADTLCVLPPHISFEDAAALPTAFGAAHQALFAAGQLRAGERVLIHGGAGGVGSFAIQLARRAGAQVIATCSTRNIDIVRRLGADRIIDHRVEDFTICSGIDLVLDTIGGGTLERSWRVLRRGGRIVSLVERGIVPRPGYRGVFVRCDGSVELLRTGVELLARGDIEVVKDSIFTLDDFRLALARMEEGHAKGKILVRMPT